MQPKSPLVFEKYLIESDITLDDIEKDCKPYLKEVRTGTSMFIRYSKTYRNEEIIKKISKTTDRKPKDTPKELHDFMDETLKKKFGWKARSQGLFVWIAPKNYLVGVNLSSEVGNYVFPIGPYKYVYNSEIFDIYAEYQQIESDFYEDYDDDTLQDKVIEYFKHWWLEHPTGLKGYKNINALTLKTRVECMIRCKSYYLIPPIKILELSNSLYLGIKKS
jgi:hypothetical protein